VQLQPLDLVKTRMQQQAGSTSLLKTLQKTIAKDGPLELWRGLNATLLRNAPGSGLYFLALHEIRARFHGVIDPQLLNLSGGMAARVAVGFALMPVTVVKVRMESSIFKDSGVLASFRAIVAQSGLRGLFAGSGSTALRDAPFAGIYLYFYEHCKAVLGRETVFPRPVISMASGIFGGVAATVITQPFDFMKVPLCVLTNKVDPNPALSTAIPKHFDWVRHRFEAGGPSELLSWCNAPSAAQEHQLGNHVDSVLRNCAVLLQPRLVVVV
jgi:solute carrier family 25 protein 38